MSSAVKMMRMLEFADSTFPVGTFSFSNGLESAVGEGIVTDAKSLEDYTRAVAMQSAYTDGIASHIAYQGLKDGDYQAIIEADKQINIFRINAEARQMLTRMGRKMAEMSIHIFNYEYMNLWYNDILENKTPGTYPVAQVLAFMASELSAKALFCCQQYGVINMVLSAALRCVRVSHYDTQKILYKLSEQAEADFEAIEQMGYEDMHSFVPQIDILASIHEKGLMRMFMS